jgi:hypothetical protein
MRSSKKLLSLLSKIEKRDYPGFGGHMNAVQVVEWLINKADFYEKRFKRVQDSYDVLNDIVREMMVKEVANSKKGGQ